MVRSFSRTHVFPFKLKSDRHWNNHFAAVVAEDVCYEVWPPKQIILHEYLLPMWGSPVGKLWDLEKLAETCKRNHRWQFFLTSAPLNVSSGKGSPSNALAMF